MLHADLRKILETEVSPSCKSLLMALAIRSSESRECWPSVPRLMKDTGLCRATVMKCLSELESLGHLSVIRESGKSNRYTLTRPADRPVQQIDPSTEQTGTRPADRPHPSSRQTPPVQQIDPNGKRKGQRKDKPEDLGFRPEDQKEVEPASVDPMVFTAGYERIKTLTLRDPDLPLWTKRMETYGDLFKTASDKLHKELCRRHREGDKYAPRFLDLAPIVELCEEMIVEQKIADQEEQETIEPQTHKQTAQADLGELENLL